MKKSFTKYLSAFLALVLILSALPMAAFAAESDGHEHTDSCCADTSAAMPAAAICKDGEHIYSTYYSALYVDCGGVHRVDEIIQYDCVLCAHSYYEYTGYTHYEEHSDVRLEQVGLDGGVPLYKYECSDCHRITYGK